MSCRTGQKQNTHAAVERASRTTLGLICVGVWFAHTPFKDYIALVIRRQEGNDFFLITQAQHALHAAELARHLGNAVVRGPHDALPFRAAAQVHDAGWDAFDDTPRLSARKLPLDILEAPWQIAVPAWAETSRLVLDAKGPAADLQVALLVSIHTLNLSHEASRVNEGPTRFDPGELRRMFEVNKFQHAQIEIQEFLRPELSLAIDQPRRLGLSMHLTDSREQQLANDYRLLQAIDLLSHCACAGQVLINPVGPLLAALPSTGYVSLQLKTASSNISSPDRLIVSPWPFDCGAISFDILFKRYPAHATRSLPEFQFFYSQAPDESLTIVVAPD